MKVIIAVVAFGAGALLTLMTGLGVGRVSNHYYAVHAYGPSGPRPVVPMTPPRNVE